MIVYLKTDEWLSSDNEGQRMTTNVTTSDKGWQRMPTSDNE